MLNLATSVPLWRDLALGDVGADVRSLEEELFRLGYPIVVDDRMGTATLAAFNEALSKIGAKGARKSLSQSEVLWLPQQAVSPATCDIALGSTLIANDAIATLDSTIVSAQAASLPSNLLPGERTLNFNGSSLPVDPAGFVVDVGALQDLDFLRENQGRDQPSQSEPLSGTLSLVAPIRVQSVPPNALFEPNGSTACLRSNGKSLPVRIVGSQLGQTFITFDGVPVPHSVEISPGRAPSCR